jgi:hypothetical protein
MVPRVEFTEKYSVYLPMRLRKSINFLTGLIFRPLWRNVLKKFFGIVLSKGTRND